MRSASAEDMCARLEVLLDLGLGYLTLERSTPTLSPGELQRLRLATQVRSNLFGVVYVLDEPSAGLHPADTEALLRALDRLKASGNSIFVVEHEIDVIRHADWIVDVGPAAGEHGGEILYSGPLEGLASVKGSQTRAATVRRPVEADGPTRTPPRRRAAGSSSRGITRNNLENLDVDISARRLHDASPACRARASRASSARRWSSSWPSALGQRIDEEDEADAISQRTPSRRSAGASRGGMEQIRRLVRVDQKPIGRTPRSNLATYTGLFDHVRKLFAGDEGGARAAATTPAASRSTSPRAAARHCEGEGFVMVELLFLPSVYAPCPTCHGARYNAKTLEITYREQEHRRGAAA